MPGQFQRASKPGQLQGSLFIDGVQEAFQVGDTVLTAILHARRSVRLSEFGGHPRAGFCLMGACQDCWVWREDGSRVRACTTPATDGLRVVTAAPDAAAAAP